ncbi:glycosyltransferase [Bradyrhizobium sp. 157]|uniref:glycosyltransferase family 2 protein n=1 Tax=Bradyrhizobium sp. 157 TaxID=2782631 RepID=UPI001FF78A3D|nr:glycosyltransferase [Bradyrhizobium sp. 157]MCK1640342.1 glycosyltransferase [Bradyrhizobium sp. 157]
MKQDILLTRFAVVASTVALALGFANVFTSIDLGADGLSIKVMLVIVFSIALLSLFYGNIVYQLTRIGQLKRHLNYLNCRDEHCNLETLYDDSPTVSILVPSFKEEISVVMQTIVSAALSEYPNRRVTLLLDDPPARSGADLVAVSATRELIVELNDTLAAAAERFCVAARTYLERASSGTAVISSERQIVGALFDDAAAVVEAIGKRYVELSQPAFAHADELFAREVIDRLVKKHRDTAALLQNGKSVDAARIQREYRRLAALFAVPIDTFERKRFANLSHAPNKAMNLNSYIGLIGRTFSISKGANGVLLLTETPADEAEITVPEADYIITIDADSIILPDYVLKLVSIMEADRGIAIAQTPYSAYPNPPTVLERVAGATTDIQYLVHQGFTAYNATFWVGANAVLRRAALDEIRMTTEERGYPIPVFIQDKTLIEDTGSTIDLAARGWRLHNHPERLAFSATPSDFGALVIQRRRWANGGLIIFPSLLELWSRGQAPRAGVLETLIRSHYLLSPTLANVGLLLLLIVPFGSEFSNIWFPIAAAPYYLLYGRDLTRTGYQWRDLLRVYALTLLLVPVNLAGVYRSLEQVATGRKSPFARTPKIKGRTAAPASHLLALFVLTATSIISAATNLWSGNLLFFGFCSINVSFFLYGFLTLIGWREAVVDIAAGFALRFGQNDVGADVTRQLAKEPTV